MNTYAKFSTGIFLFYAMVFFVPATDKGYYYKVSDWLGYFVNGTVWFFLLITQCMISVHLFFTKRLNSEIRVIFFSGLVFIVLDGLVGLSGSTGSFRQLGFVLIATIPVFWVDEYHIRRALHFAGAIAGLASLDSLLLIYSGDHLLPISSKLLLDFVESDIAVGNISNSMYGNTNAAGSFFLMLFVLFIFRYFYKIENFTNNSLITWLLCFVGLSLTAAFGPIILFCIFICCSCIGRPSKVKWIFFIAGAAALLFAYTYSFEYIDYKLDSGGVKAERRKLAFAEIFGDIKVFLFGWKFFANPDSIFWSESTLADVWLNFGLLGAVTFLILNFFNFRAYFAAGNYLICFAIVVIMVLHLTQTASLMVPNVVIFVMLRMTFYNIYKCRLAASKQRAVGASVKCCLATPAQIF
jgi:hypothetical protein